MVIRNRGEYNADHEKRGQADDSFGQKMKKRPAAVHSHSLSASASR
jgi:hypothetical protein